MYLHREGDNSRQQRRHPVEDADDVGGDERLLASRTLSSEIKTKTAKTARETWKMSCNAVHAITVRFLREGRQIVCA